MANWTCSSIGLPRPIAVDQFVLVEAAETYQGASKPFSFDDAHARFAWASSKIRHIKLSHLGGPDRSPRERADHPEERHRLRFGRRASGRRRAPARRGRDYEPRDAPRASPGRARGAATSDDDAALRLRGHRGAALLVLSDTSGGVSSHAAAAARPLGPARRRMARPIWRGDARGILALPGSADGRLPFEVRFGAIDAPPLRNAGRHLTSVNPSTRDPDRNSTVSSTRSGPARAPHGPSTSLAVGPITCIIEAGGTPSVLPVRCRRNLKRLQARLGNNHAPMPALWRRRAVRAWAWLRTLRAWPEPWVAFVNRYFEDLLRLTAPFLLAAEAVRTAGTAVAQRGSATVSRNPLAARSTTNSSTSSSQSLSPTT